MATQIPVLQLPDTGEIVLSRREAGDPLLAAWRIAAADAQAAYDHWAGRPGVLTHATYLAAVDQADAAAASLAADRRAMRAAVTHGPLPLAA